MQKQLCSSIEWLFRKKIPAKCPGNPDLYILYAKDAGGMAIGLWNIFADEIICPVVEPDRAYTHAEFIHCSGTLSADKITLDTIPPFGFALIALQ